MATEISPQQRQLLLESGQNPNLISGPALLGAQQRSGVEAQQTQARGLISEFFEDPMRQSEINNQIQAQLDVSLANIGMQAQESERQARFQAGQTGQAGGSVQLDRNTGIQQLAGQQVAGATGAAGQQRFGLEQQLQQQQLNELLNTFLRPQAFGQSQQALLGSVGLQTGQVAGGQRAASQLNTAQQFGADEVSRALGGTLTNLGNASQLNTNIQGQQATQAQLEELLRSLQNNNSGGLL